MIRTFTEGGFDKGVFARSDVVFRDRSDRGSRGTTTHGCNLSRITPNETFSDGGIRKVHLRQIAEVGLLLQVCADTPEEWYAILRPEIL